MEIKKCKYCGEPMKKVLMPPESDWGVEYFLVCMNDDCGYFKRGWQWMEEKYKVKASYRYKIDPTTGSEAPLPVKSPNDMKDWVVHQFNEADLGDQK